MASIGLSLTIVLQEIKNLITSFQTLIESAQAAQGEIPELALLLLKRSTNLHEALITAEAKFRMENMPTAIVTATQLLHDTLKDVTAVAAEVNGASFIKRMALAKQYQETLKKAGNTLTAIACDLHLIFNLHFSFEFMAAEFKAAYVRDNAKTQALTLPPRFHSAPKQKGDILIHNMREDIASGKATLLQEIVSDYELLQGKEQEIADFPASMDALGERNDPLPL
ncbi:hypothetical protein GGF32_002830 [Allomyces javanicus]|nr:hypothetical protein GGF32_002830 [Allomyces javanicus]